MLFPTAPQPVPVAPIREQPQPEEKYVTFRLFGTECKVRFNDNERFTLGKCDNNALASAWERMSGEEYNNTICDCEDRSILLSRLVRELLGLDVILVYYPGHIATAVCFGSDVTGDYITLNGKRFVVCDPTYIGAPVGVTIPDMDNATANVIMLNRQ